MSLKHPFILMIKTIDDNGGNWAELSNVILVKYKCVPKMINIGMKRIYLNYFIY